MYTVLRFSCANTEALRSIIEALEISNRGLFTGMDNEQNKFSCSLSDVSDQHQHWMDISSIFFKIQPVLNLANKLGVNLELDAAIESDDFGYLYAEVNPGKSLLKLIVDNNIDLVITIYKDKI